MCVSLMQPCVVVTTWFPYKQFVNQRYMYKESESMGLLYVILPQDNYKSTQMFCALVRLKRNLAAVQINAHRHTPSHDHF